MDTQVIFDLGVDHRRATRHAVRQFEKCCGMDRYSGL